MSRLDSRLLRALDDWLFPERVACLCCDAALGNDDQSGLCPGCAQALSRLAGEIDTVSLLKPRLMCYNISGDENEEIRDNH